MAALRMQEMTLRSEGHHIIHLRSVAREKNVQIPRMGDLGAQCVQSSRIAGITSVREGFERYPFGYEAAKRGLFRRHMSIGRETHRLVLVRPARPRTSISSARLGGIEGSRTRIS
jgi:hypothetical protein